MRLFPLILAVAAMVLLAALVVKAQPALKARADGLPMCYRYCADLSQYDNVSERN